MTIDSDNVSQYVTVEKNFYVDKHSIVRKIWGKADTILLIFAGASAEFSLNKAVDWLYFTGRLPSDPIGRLFSTVSYAGEIIFSSTEQANAAIDKMRNIHSAVEASRGATIPDAAYRDVLFMLIYYSMSAFEVLERKLSEHEKEEVVKVFCRVGERMQIPGLPTDYPSWISMYNYHTMHNLVKTKYTTDLFRQYKKHLGFIRFQILLEAQKLVVTRRVRKLLGFGAIRYLTPFLAVYKFSRKFGADRVFKSILLPVDYRQRIKRLDRPQ